MPSQPLAERPMGMLVGRGEGSPRAGFLWLFPLHGIETQWLSAQLQHGSRGSQEWRGHPHPTQGPCFSSSTPAPTYTLAWPSLGGGGVSAPRTKLILHSLQLTPYSLQLLGEQLTWKLTEKGCSPPTREASEIQAVLLPLA